MIIEFKFAVLALAKHRVNYNWHSYVITQLTRDKVLNFGNISEFLLDLNLFDGFICL